MSSIESSLAMPYFGPEPEAAPIKPYAGPDYVSYQPKVTLREQLSYIKLSTILDIATAIYGIFLKHKTFLLQNIYVRCSERVQSHLGTVVESAIGDSMLGGPCIGPYWSRYNTGVLAVRKLC